MFNWIKPIISNITRIITNPKCIYCSTYKINQTQAKSESGGDGEQQRRTTIQAVPSPENPNRPRRRRRLRQILQRRNPSRLRLSRQNPNHLVLRHPLPPPPPHRPLRRHLRPRLVLRLSLHLLRLR